VVFADGAENGGGNWQMSGGFFVERTTSSRTGAQRFRSNPAAQYDANTSSWMISSPFDLTGSSNVTLTYGWKAQTEQNWDFFQVYATADGGASWTQLSSFSGQSEGFPGWAPLAALDLSAFAGEPSVQIAFGLTSDASVNGWGAAVDDIEVDAR
jgi:hypothetical protein